MSFLLGFLGAILGIIVVILSIVGVIIIGLNKKIGKNRVKELINIAKNHESIQQEELARKKSVKGMTKLIEPEIIRDFPDFNKNLLFNKIESNLIKIFNAIENKNAEKIKKDKDLELMVYMIEEQIEDLKNRNIEIKYDDVVFHEHAIKNYEKSEGMVTITTSTTLEYYYKNNENKNSNYEVQKQTRYTCKFVYIYDENKMETNNNVFVIRCPNCGAPLRSLKINECEYCCSHIEPINLKIWKMSSYKEDYN